METSVALCFISLWSIAISQDSVSNSVNLCKYYYISSSSDYISTGNSFSQSSVQYSDMGSSVFQPNSNLYIDTMYDCCPGWLANSDGQCTVVCPGGFYGQNCQYECRCLNNGVCNPMNGSCSCPAGWEGDFCQRQCNNRYGLNCQNPCPDCGNGFCNTVTGECVCHVGFSGIACSYQCSSTLGTCHDITNDICTRCQNGATCDPSGFCICDAGWEGTYCQKECDYNDYGFDCVSDCNCKNGAYCNSVNGDCICLHGYYGDRCQNRCPAFLYGDQCLQECLCINADGCNHVTGTCYCSSGWRGTHCDIPCGNGFWGVNCQNQCNCGSDACDPTTGECPSISGLCSSSPCENGGVCINQDSLFVCVCPSEYTGETCQMRAPCTAIPCQHGGSCIDIGTTNYYCMCPTGYTGDNCQMVPGCLSDPCKNSGVCYDLANGGYYCQCGDEFEGINCQIVEGSIEVTDPMTTTGIATLPPHTTPNINIGGESSESSQGFPVVTLLGGLAGVLAVGLIVAVLLICYFRRRQAGKSSNKNKSTSPAPPALPPPRKDINDDNATYEQYMPMDGKKLNPYAEYQPNQGAVYLELNDDAGPNSVTNPSYVGGESTKAIANKKINLNTPVPLGGGTRALPARPGEEPVYETLPAEYDYMVPVGEDPNKYMSLDNQSREKQEYTTLGANADKYMSLDDQSRNKEAYTSLTTTGNSK